MKDRERAFLGLAFCLVGRAHFARCLSLSFCYRGRSWWLNLALWSLSLVPCRPCARSGIPSPV